MLNKGTSFLAMFQGYVLLVHNTLLKGLLGHHRGQMRTVGRPSESWGQKNPILPAEMLI